MGHLSAILFIRASTAVTWYVTRIQRRQHLPRANGCQPPKKYPHKDTLFGLDLFFQTGKLFKGNQYLPELVRRYHEYGSTFETKSFGSFAVNSIRPENLQTRLSFSCPPCVRPVLQTLSYLQKEMLNRKTIQLCRAFESSYRSLVRGSETVARVL